MLNLSNDTSEIQIVTVNGVDAITVQASWTDLYPNTHVYGQTAVGGDQNTPPITTATTTTIVPSPPTNTDRNVKFLFITNSSSVPCAIFVQHFDGTNIIPVWLPGVGGAGFVLQPGWAIEYNSDGNGWVVYDQDGKIQVSGSIFNITGGVFIQAGTQTVTGGTAVFSNSNNVTFGLSNSSVVTAIAAINVSAGTTSNGLSAVTFSNGNGVSFGLNGSVVTASVVAGAGASINFSGGTTSNNLSAITFANSNGVSFGLNGSVMTASVVPMVGTISCFSQDADFATNFPVGQGILSLQKLSLPMNLLATQLAMLADFRGNVLSSGAVTVSHAVYTLSGGTAVLASSGFRTISWVSSQYSNASGTRYRTIAVSYSMTPGDYLCAWCISTANSVIVQPFGRMAANIVGGFDGVETAYFLNGSSVSSVLAFPVSVMASDTNYARTGFSALLQPGAILLGTN